MEFQIKLIDKTHEYESKYMIEKNEATKYVQSLMNELKCASTQRIFIVYLELSSGDLEYFQFQQKRKRRTSLYEHECRVIFGMYNFPQTLPLIVYSYTTIPLSKAYEIYAKLCSMETTDI